MFLNLNKKIFEIIFCLLIVVYFYKLYFEFFIPISGDELNSILVYSSNIKTLFLKNFPHNAVFYHSIGYIKSIIFGFELNGFRMITFIFILLHFFIIKKLNYDELKLSLFFILILISNYSLYSGIYVGYIFSSSIFVSIYYLINQNKKDENNRLILILLFVQLYNHLVNIYLVLPILLVMFLFSEKKKFFYNSILFFGLPLIIFYSISIILTGLSAIKISDLSLSGVLNTFINQFEILVLKGFKGIFFYEGITTVQKFSFTESIKNIYQYDKPTLFVIFTSLFTILINFIKKKQILLSSIVLIHFLLFFIFNKQPPPRIFTGFFCFYIFFSFTLIDYLNYEKYLKIIKYISIFFIILSLVKFNFLKIIENGVYAEDINFTENKISLNLLKEKCHLVNNNFTEMQKRNFYFNYLNYCNKNFNLNEFLVYYRS